MSRREAFSTMAVAPLALSTIAARLTSAKPIASQGNPELVALYTEVKQAEHDYVAAHTAVKTCRPEFEQAVPPVPDGLSPERDDKLWFLAERIEGDFVYVDPKTEQRILTSKGLISAAEWPSLQNRPASSRTNRYRARL